MIRPLTAIQDVKGTVKFDGGAYHIELKTHEGFGISADPIPPKLVKYLSSSTLQFVEAGSIQVGSANFYRSSYDSQSAGYADRFDSVSVSAFDGGKFRQTESHNHFIFATSKAWDPHAQVEWWNRPSCGYDAFVVFDGPAIISKIIDAFYAAYSEAIYVVGSCRYNQSSYVPHNKYMKIDILTCLNKGRHLLWENEYRLSIQSNLADEKQRLRLDIENIFEAITQIIVFDKSKLDAGLLVPTRRYLAAGTRPIP